MKYYFLTLFNLLFLAQNTLAQNDGDALFDNNYVHEIRITFEGDDFWQVLTDNYNNSPAESIPYLQGTVSIDGNQLDSIGVRQKGNSSHFAANYLKKPLKLDFNEYVSGGNYDGLKKINLANGVGDPAMQRDVLAYNMLNEMGIHVPRTSYAKVFLNDTYWGLYVIIEQIDKTFIKGHFLNEDGDLYKNIGFSTLAWQGNNASNYESEIALRTNKSTSDFSDFIEFVDVLNNTSDDEFTEAIASVFNVDYYLRILAIDIISNDWDSYIDFGRNFYLYHEPSSDLFFWIPWDYNLCMGGSFGFGPQAEDNYPLILNNPSKILISRILNVPEFREQYLNYCCQILAHNFTIDRLSSIIDYNVDLIAEAVAEDMNYAFTLDEFNYDISDGDNSSFVPSLKEYINDRLDYYDQDLLDLGHVCESTNSFVAWHDLVINEFVAANDSLSGIVDQNGQADDWIELYNNTDAVIDLTDFYLTDNFTNLKKWAFPAGTSIGIDDYLIVWADEDGHQEGFHTNFKLAASGEQLMLAHFNGTIIDSLSYGLQTANIPSARLPNGTGEFTENMPTFGRNNEEPTATTELRKINFKVYPNPTKDYITLDFGNNMQKGNIDIRVRNLLGQLVYSTKGTNYFNLNINAKNWKSGIYLIEVSGNNFRSVEKVVVE